MLSRSAILALGTDHVVCANLCLQGALLQLLEVPANQRHDIYHQVFCIMFAVALELWPTDYDGSRKLTCPMLLQGCHLGGLCCGQTCSWNCQSPPYFRKSAQVNVPAVRGASETQHLRLTVPPCDLTWQQ